MEIDLLTLGRTIRNCMDLADLHKQFILMIVDLLLNCLSVDYVEIQFSPLFLHFTADCSTIELKYRGALRFSRTQMVLKTEFRTSLF